ncbi:MAG TPA: zinc ribbon domain-containing protein [Desulfosporosinus sp.]|nr:zinc ribbon domain-containing protein [Desulfosporosinus sp.]
MKCEKCMTGIPLDARFCPNCGEKVEMFNEGVRGNEISIEWLIILFKKLGFEVEINTDGDSFIGKNKESFNYKVNLATDLKVITIGCNFAMKQKNISDVNKLQDALAKANSMSHLGIFSLSDNNKVLNIITHINLTELMIERDILVYLNIYEKNLMQLIESLEIMEI